MPTAKKSTNSTRSSTKKSATRKPDSAVQGEGDYISARKYNDRTRAFVAKMTGGKAAAPSGAKPSPAELRAAEKKALARSKGRAGDRADARVMKENVTAASAKGRRRG